MRFTKSNDVYKVIRITGVQDNILGICFSDKECEIEIVEWDIKRGAKVKSSRDEVLEEVLSGLKWINEDLGKTYFLSKIYFLPSDSSSNSVYELLIKSLISHFDSGNEFVEV